jgi:tetratricopeptide (TPR) repeat protein
MARKQSTSAPKELTVEQALAQAQAHWNAGQADQAEIYCQRVLAAWPGHADALHLLGIMAHAYGNLDLAISHLRRACQAPRAPAIYLSNLAEMCRQRGLLPEAEEAARRAVAQDVNLIAAWNNLGIVLQESGKLDESLICLERVVAARPDAPESRNNLGNTLKRSGRLQQAAAQYEKAIALAPAYAEAHSNLANLLNDLGQHDRAVAEGRRAVELNPRLADAYINLAAVETDRHRHAEALRCLDALLAVIPVHAGALAARALALKQLFRFDEALQSARQAVAAGPQNADTWSALGQCLQAIEQFDGALEAFDRAQAMPSIAGEAIVLNRGTLLMEFGRFDEAITCFDRGLALYPRSARLWFNRSELKSFTADDPDLARMEALLGPGGVESLNDRIAMQFALGKAWMDAGDPDRAFRHLADGNRMKRATFAYDAEATGRWIAGIGSAFDQGAFDRLGGASNESDLPIFVVGLPRSGTSLIEQILASHPAVSGAGELPIVERLAAAFGAFPDSIAALNRDSLNRLGTQYLELVRPLAKDRSRLVDKMPANFLYAGLIHLMLPHARIINCRRNPIDTCLSCYSKLFSAEQAFTYDLVELGRFYRDYEALMEGWRRLLPDNRFMDVDYEKIVDDPETESRRLLSFVGLEWNDACMRFYENRRVVKTASLRQVRKPIYGTSKGRWKPYAAHLGPLLSALGVAAP